MLESVKCETITIEREKAQAREELNDLRRFLFELEERLNKLEATMNPKK